MRFVQFILALVFLAGIVAGCLGAFFYMARWTMEDAIIVSMLLLGLAVHFLKKSIEAKRGGGTVSVREYWIDHKARSALSFVGACAVFVLLYGTPELTKITAFSIGYMADSAANMIAKRGSRWAQ